MGASRNYYSGFSLLELVITISILGILAAAAIPYSKSLIERVRLQTTANAIKHQLYMARSRALGDSQVHCGVFFDTLSKPNSIKTFLDDGTSIGNDTYDQGSDHIFMAPYQLPATLKLQIGGAGHDNVIIFRGDGSAKVRGLTLTIINKINETKKISVLASTGKIKAY